MWKWVVGFIVFCVAMRLLVWILKPYFRSFGERLVEYAVATAPTPVPMKELPPPIPTKKKWKREEYVRDYLQTKFGVLFPNVRPKWLVNPLTGKCLEIDCYNADLQLAVEVSGEQHYFQENYFYKGDRSKFLAQLYRDKVKQELILERGINLIVVPYTIPISQISSYLHNAISQLKL